MPQLAIFAALAGGSAIAGGLANRAKKQTSTQTTTRLLPSQYEPLESDLIGQLMKQLQNPGEGIEPLRLSARNAVNRNFAGVGQALSDRFQSGGLQGESGKFGSATRATELARVGSLSGLEGDFAKLTLDRGDNALSLAQRLLQAAQGQTTTSETQLPGNVAAGALGGGLNTLTTLFALDQFLKGRESNSLGKVNT